MKNSHRFVHLFILLCLVVSALTVQLLNTSTSYAAASYAAAQVASGANHTCALTTTGGVKCWGRNDHGQLGNGSTSASGVGINSPVDVSGLTSGVSAIAAGGDHTCAILTSDGSIECWGANNLGQLGDGSTNESNVPVTVSGLTGVLAIGLGDSHSCAVTSSGGLKCWGWDYYGQLGDNGAFATHIDTPTDVSGLSSGVTEVVGGFDFTCAIVSGGAKCWGQNVSGELGTSDNSPYLVPTDVSGLTSGVSKLVASYQTACALTGGGAVECWGWNDQGQLGNNSQSNSNAPVQVSGLTSDVGDVSLGTHFGCALIASTHAAKCWGENGSYQLGATGGTYPALTPVDSNLTSSGAALSSGADHSCALIDTGDIRCWGNNDYGQLGSGDNYSYYVPHDVVGFSGNGPETPTPTHTSTSTASLTPTPVGQVAAMAVTSGTNHACAITSTGTVKCWGRNDHGQLGAGFTSASGTGIDATEDVIGLSDVTAIAAGGDHTCAIVSGGTLECWGANDHGQLGDGTTNDSNVPVTVSGLTGVIGIGLGDYDTCAIVTGGALKCWGWDYYGQLGTGSIPSYPHDVATPTDVSGLSSGVTAVVGSYDFTCAIQSGAVLCWGYNDKGQLGTGDNTQYTTPAAVSGLTSGATEIASAYDDACAVVSGGVKCWGLNSEGQLGNNSYADSNAPVDVTGLTSDVSDVSVGLHFACASITSTGGVKCWGVQQSTANGSWQLGVNSGPGQFGSITPVDSTLASGVSSLDAGVAHTCALVAYGDVECWGANDSGQLGRGNYNQSLPGYVVGFEGNIEPTATPTFTPTFTPTLTPTSTPTFTPTSTATSTPTFTPSPTFTVTPGIPTSPVLASPVDGFILNIRRPTFTWLPIPNATGYVLQVSTSSTFSTTAINVTIATTAYTPKADLKANKQYYWRIKAKNSYGGGPYSAIWSFHTGNPPSVPSLSAPSNGALVAVTSPLFDWNSSTLPTGVTFNDYHIQVATDSGFTNVIYDNSISGISSSQDGSAVLQRGTTYYWRVQSIGTYNAMPQYSSWSAYRSVRIAYPAPTLSSPTNGETVSSRRPTFTWDAIPGATSYKIQVATSSSFGTLLVSTKVALPTYTPTTDLKAHKILYWRVQALGLYGPSSWPTVWWFTTP